MKSNNMSSAEIENPDAFKFNDENDEFLYHVTSIDCAKKICESEFSGSATRMFGSSYKEHSKNRVFLTEKSGVMFWMARVEDRLFDAFDEPPAVAVLKIPKHAIASHLSVDEIGSTDSRHESYFIHLEKINETVFGPGAQMVSKFDETFDEWFKGSKIVTSEGRPQVLYHGTVASFAEFRTSPGWFGDGVYLTPDASLATEFAEDVADEHLDGTNVIPVYVNLKNPYVFQEKDTPVASNIQLMREIGFSDAKIEKLSAGGMQRSHVECAIAISEELQRKGFDGIVAHSLGEELEYVAFDPDQIKFAIARNWNYDIGERLKDVLPEEVRRYVRP